MPPILIIIIAIIVLIITIFLVNNNPQPVEQNTQPSQNEEELNKNVEVKSFKTGKSYLVPSRMFQASLGFYLLLMGITLPKNFMNNHSWTEFISLGLMLVNISLSISTVLTTFIFALRTKDSTLFTIFVGYLGAYSPRKSNFHVLIP